MTRSALARRGERVGRDAIDESRGRLRLDGSTPAAPGPSPRARAIENTAVEMRRSSPDANRPTHGATQPQRLAKALNATMRHSLSRICANRPDQRWCTGLQWGMAASGTAHWQAVMAACTEEPERPAPICACARGALRRRRDGNQYKERHERPGCRSRWSRCVRCSGRRHLFR